MDAEKRGRSFIDASTDALIESGRVAGDHRGVGDMRAIFL